MTWGCQYQLNDFCLKMKRDCQPGMPGCVLFGKVSFIKIKKEGTKMGNIDTLDLRELPPVERHKQIFERWDALQSGETLKIINDHDPKPLRYQFEAEHANQFEWEYHESGPKDWIVTIKKN